MGLCATKLVWIWEQEENETEKGRRFRGIKNSPPPLHPSLCSLLARRKRLKSELDFRKIRKKSVSEQSRCQ
jgi:hypothetical protein